MEAAEYASVIRGMIEHEDQLRDQRLGWLFALNGFLFAALGFAWQESDSTPLVVVLAGVGVLIALSSRISLTSSTLAIARLGRLGRNVQPNGTFDVPPVIALRTSERGAELEIRKSEQKGVRARLAAWVYPWNAVPWILIVGWVVIALARLNR
jgi:hypothetical protein